MSRRERGVCGEGEGIRAFEKVSVESISLIRTHANSGGSSRSASIEIDYWRRRILQRNR